jgi:glutathione synthase/RimK-type ligase-like ATP-grasp enzyme
MFDLILIIADKFDVHADTVQERFLRSGTKFFRLDLDTESLKTTYATFNENHWELETATGKLDTRSVTKVWLRRSSVEVSLEERQDRGVDTQIWCSEWNKTLSGIYLSLQNARWLNPLREGLRAENKYLQMETARSVGMKMPDTIVSNRKSELMAFADKYQYVALKLMSQDLFLDEEVKCDPVSGQ